MVHLIKFVYDIGWIKVKLKIKLTGGGIFIVGQEQDAPGSKFSALESFRGSLTRLNIWNRILTRVEISEAMNSCNEVTGNVASWADFHNGIHGLIQVKVAEEIIQCWHLHTT